MTCKSMKNALAFASNPISKGSATVNPVPHPTDLKIQDFSAYSIIIDARSPREFAEDHLPDAVNLPVVNNEEYAEVGTLHRSNTHAAYLIGVEYSLKNISAAIKEVIAPLDPALPVLVYCFRGGKRSLLWANTLRTIGYKVDVLQGGWKAYRRWIVGALETLPRAFDYRVLCGPTGSGKTRLLHALKARGEQILDLEGLAHHRGSLIGALPGDPQPTQKCFDSSLMAMMRSYTPERPIWLEAESKKIGALGLPEGLFQAMHAAPFIRVNAPMAARVRLWQEDYAHFSSDPQGLLRKLAPLKPLVGGEELAIWQALADAGQMPELFERLMRNHYDPAYLRSTSRHYKGFAEAPEIMLERLDADYLLEVAHSLISREQVRR